MLKSVCENLRDFIPQFTQAAELSPASFVIINTQREFYFNNSASFASYNDVATTSQNYTNFITAQASQIVTVR